MLDPPSLQNNTTNVVIHQNSRKLLMMDILMSETCWEHKKWNKIASDIKLVFYSSTITMMHGPINIRCLTLYGGADKSLARPGRKQANVSVRTALISVDILPCRKEKTWWSLACRYCWNRTRPWYASELVSFLVGLRTYQHPGICVRKSDASWRQCNNWLYIFVCGSEIVISI